MSILQSVVDSAPFFKAVMKEDVVLAVMDRTHFLAFIPSKKVNMMANPGDPVPDDDQNFKEALLGNIAEGRLPRDVYGFTFFGKAIPIRDHSQQVIGVLGIGYNIEDEVLLEDAMAVLSENIQMLQERVNHLAYHSQESAATSETILSTAKAVAEHSTQMNVIVNFIKNISSQTQLLGLNAAIEAARFGDQGAAFSVVAQRMRELSTESNQALKQIEAFLSEIHSNVQTVSNGLQTISASTADTSTLVDEFTRSIEKLHDVSRKMDTFISQVTS